MGLSLLLVCLVCHYTGRARKLRKRKCSTSHKQEEGMLANFVLVLKSNCRYSQKYSSQYMEALFCKVSFSRVNCSWKTTLLNRYALVEGRFLDWKFFLDWKLCASSITRMLLENIWLLLFCTHCRIYSDFTYSFKEHKLIIRRWSCGFSVAV